jgi:hypothetical protein
VPCSSNAEIQQNVEFRRPRRRLRRIILALMLAASLPQPIHAQPPAPTSTETPAANTSPVQPAPRPMTMEIVIVFLMVAAALFVVCKSSRRN